MLKLHILLASSLGATWDKFIDALKSIPSLIRDFIEYFGHVPLDQLTASLIVGAAFGAILTAVVYLVAQDRLILPRFAQRSLLIAGAGVILLVWNPGILAAVIGFLAALLWLGFTYEDQELLFWLYFIPRLLRRQSGTGTDKPLLPSYSPQTFLEAGFLGVATLLDLSLGIALPIGAGVLVLHDLVFGHALRDFIRANSAGRLFAPVGLQSMVVGGGLGAVVGALGSQFLMYATEHCTYGPDVSSFEYRLGMGLTAISASFLLIPLWTWILRRNHKLRPSTEITSGNFRGFFVPYTLLLPTLIILVFFLYYPAVQIVNMSLTAALFGGNRSKFVCLNNYEKLLDSNVYHSSFVVTFQITLAIILIGMGIALMIAVLANQKLRFAGVYRTWLIWPYAVSPVVTGAIFSLIFHPQIGPVNWILHELFGIRPQWFTNVSLAPWVVILAAIWNSLGFNILFYVAGLQNIPEDLLEAASIDGANRVQRFFRITFPLLSPFTFFLLVTNVTYSFFSIFGAVDTLTQGGPWRMKEGGLQGATNVLIYNLYQDAFEHQNKVGLAASQSLILFLLVAGLTILQFRYVERRVTYGG